MRDDIVRVLRLGAARPCDRHLASFDRANLRFGVRPVRDDADRLSGLFARLGAGSLSLVYVPTRGLAEGLTRVLRERGLRAHPYHAGLEATVRRQVLGRFQRAETDVVVATCAFGMGIDQPGVRRVLHWGMPATLESYYQEAGRAGRDGDAADCVVFAGRRDTHLHRAQLDVTFPPRALVERVWAGAGDLRVAGPVRESIERLRAERAEMASDAEFWTAVRRRRRVAEGRLASARAYADGRGCRRAAMLRYFGERARSCTGCDRCGMDA